MRISVLIQMGLGLVVWLMGGLLAGCQEPGAAELQQGYLALEQRQYDQALAAAERYLHENPAGRSTAGALYLKGRAIEQRVKRDQAEAAANLRQAKAHYIEALQLAPTRPLDAYIYTSIGNTCYWLGDYSGAASYWKEAYMRLAPGDLSGWVLYRIGLCQQRMGQWTDADGTFARVGQEFPDTEAAERAQAHRGYRGFYVQVAAFSAQASADQLVRDLRAKGFPAGRQPRPERSLHAVVVGPHGTYADATAMRARLAGQFKDALIIP